MANNLEFKISAEDQASRVVETVQHKIQNFGKDVAKMALGFAGPLALVQYGLGKIGELMDERKKKQEDLNKIISEGGADQIENQRKAHSELNVELDKEVKSLLAIKTLREESVKKTKEKVELNKAAATEFLTNSPEGQEMVYAQFLKNNPKGLGRNVFSNQRPVLVEQMSADLKIQEQIFDIQKRKNLEFDKEQQAKSDALHLLEKQFEAEDKLFQETEKRRKLDLSYIERIKKAEEAITNAKIKQNEFKLTVSSLREIGGGLAGESAAIANQINTGPSNIGEILNAEQWQDAAFKMKEVADLQKATFTDFGKFIQSVPQLLNSPYSGVFTQSGVNTKTPDGN